MVQTMDMTNSVVGIESVTVPAGQFADAVRVDTAGTIAIAFSMGGTPSRLQRLKWLTQAGTSATSAWCART